VFCPHKKITSQTIRISCALVILCTGATTRTKFYNIIVDSRFWKMMFGIGSLLKMRQKYLKKPQKPGSAGVFK
jgi:hypothetical protein